MCLSDSKRNGTNGKFLHCDFSSSSPSFYSPDYNIVSRRANLSCSLDRTFQTVGAIAPYKSGRLRRPDVVIPVCVNFVGANAPTKFTQTGRKGEAAAQPLRVQEYCPHGFKSR